MNTMKMTRWSGLALLVLLGSPAASPAQEPVYIPLKVELVVTRQDGEATERRTHVLRVAAIRTSGTELRIGREVPVADKYRNVGTNIQCRAESRGEQFLLWLSLEQSSLASSHGPPSFHTFNVQDQLIVSDGEEVELVRSSSPDSEETWSVTVKVTVER